MSVTPRRTPNLKNHQQDIDALQARVERLEARVAAPASWWDSAKSWIPFAACCGLIVLAIILPGRISFLEGGNATAENAARVAQSAQEALSLLNTTVHTLSDIVVNQLRP